MNRNNRILESAFVIVCGSAFLSLTFLPSLIFAQHGGCRMGNSAYFDGWHSGVPAEYQLTAAQQDKISEIRIALLAKIGPLEAKLLAKRAEADEYASQSEVSENKIGAYVRQIEETRLGARASINKILTREQRAFYADNLDGWFSSYDAMGCMSSGMGMYGLGMCPMMGY